MLRTTKDSTLRAAAGRQRPVRGRRVVIARLLMLWVFLVSLYFLWEASTYRGLYAFIAEWQFEQFGHYLPILTFALPVLLFGSPAAWLLKKRERADRRDLRDRRGNEAAAATGSNLRRVLFGFAGGLAGAAVVSLLWTLTLPRFVPPTRTITVGAPDSIAPDRGPAILRGEILYTRTSAFAQDLLFTTRGVRFAPMIAPGAKDRSIRYLVELLPTDMVDPRVPVPIASRSGVLIRNSLPGSIVRLYRYAGYELEPPYYVLYESRQTLLRPYLLTAIQLAIAAFVALLLALSQHHHMRRAFAKDAPEPL